MARAADPPAEIVLPAQTCFGKDAHLAITNQGLALLRVDGRRPRSIQRTAVDTVRLRGRDGRVTVNVRTGREVLLRCRVNATLPAVRAAFRRNGWALHDP